MKDLPEVVTLHGPSGSRTGDLSIAGPTCRRPAIRQPTPSAESFDRGGRTTSTRGVVRATPADSTSSSAALSCSRRRSFAMFL